jgi:phosphoribosyl 1,2-cyclic phosphodiesterase
MISVQTLGSSSKGNCYRLLSGGRSLLLECGLPWKEIQRKLNFKTTDLDGCLVSHGHGDHSRAMTEVLRAGVDVYASFETLESRGVFGHHNAYAVNQSVVQWRINDFWSVRAFDLVHDAEGTLGFIITDDKGDTLAFLTDTAYCKYKMPTCEIIMVEANFSEAILQKCVNAGVIDPGRAKRVRENHMSVERVVYFLKANDLSRCREIRLIHLSDGNSDADLFKRMVQEATGIPTYVEG